MLWLGRFPNLMGKTRYIFFVFLALLTAALAGFQQRARAFATFSFSDNSILLSDLPTNRLIQVMDLSDTGWMAGPTLAGLSWSHPMHMSMDACGRVYLVDRDNRRIVRLDDVTRVAKYAAGSDVMYCRIV